MAEKFNGKKYSFEPVFTRGKRSERTGSEREREYVTLIYIHCIVDENKLCYLPFVKDSQNKNDGFFLLRLMRTHTRSQVFGFQTVLFLSLNRIKVAQYPAIYA